MQLRLVLGVLFGMLFKIMVQAHFCSRGVLRGDAFGGAGLQALLSGVILVFQFSFVSSLNRCPYASVGLQYNGWFLQMRGFYRCRKMA